AKDDDLVPVARESTREECADLTGTAGNDNLHSLALSAEESRPAGRRSPRGCFRSFARMIANNGRKDPYSRCAGVSCCDSSSALTFEACFSIYALCSSKVMSRM